jgi:uncharacterized cupin superfamily protein
VSVPILNIHDAEVAREIKHGDKFAAKIVPIGAKLGSRKLGYNLTIVAPGKRASPFHNHHANEEKFLVIEGSGTLRYGNAEYPVREGDVIACPPGGPDTAHQLVNTGATELKFLAVSTMIDTDIWQYPDSKKWGGVGGRLPNARPGEASFPSRLAADGSEVEYWRGE